MQVSRGTGPGVPQNFPGPQMGEQMFNTCLVKTKNIILHLLQFRQLCVPDVTTRTGTPTLTRTIMVPQCKIEKK